MPSSVREGRGRQKRTGLPRRGDGERRCPREGDISGRLLFNGWRNRDNGVSAGPFRGSARPVGVFSRQLRLDPFVNSRQACGSAPIRRLIEESSGDLRIR